MTSDPTANCPLAAPTQASANARLGWRRILKRILFRADLVAYLRRPLYFLIRLRGLTREELETNPVFDARHFGSPEPVVVGDPITDGNTPSEILQQFAAKTAEIGTPFACVVPDVELCGPHAVGFDSGGRVILETTPPVYFKKEHLYKNVPLRALRDRFRKLADAPAVEVAFSFLNEWEGNYWHWLVDSLTRLEGVEHYCREKGLRPQLIVKAKPNRMQLASLALMGYDEADFIRWKMKRLRVKQLIVSPFRREYRDGEYHISSPRALRFVTDRIVRNLPPVAAGAEPMAERVFISRRLTAARRIVNEEAVLAALTPLGFRSYTLEEMDLAEQVRLFSQAKVVVAPHGAGLTNQIFGRDLTIVELFGEECPVCYSGQARALGFKYGFLRFSKRPGDLRGQDADFIVDLDRLLAFLGDVLGPPTPDLSSRPAPLAVS